MNLINTRFYIIVILDTVKDIHLFTFKYKVLLTYVKRQKDDYVHILQHQIRRNIISKYRYYILALFKLNYPLFQ